MKLLRSTLPLAALLGLLFAGAPRAAAEEEEGVELYKKVVKSCVFIVTPVKGGYAMGSGSLIDAEKKLVLTNWHVVDEEDTVFVQFPVYLKSGEIMTDKQEYIKRIPAGLAIKGKVRYRDKSRDLAIVSLERIPAGTPAIPLAKKSVSVGATTWNIGSPGGVSQVFSITEGRVRAVAVEKFLVGGGSPDSVFEVRAKMVTTTNPSNQGDSGGPLFDRRGYQVGVTQSGNTKLNLVSKFVDISEVRALLNEKKITIKELSTEEDPKVTTTGATIKKDTVDSPGNGSASPKKDDAVPTPPVVKDTTPKDTTPTATPEQEAQAKRELQRAKLFAEGEDNRPTYEAKMKDIVKKYPGTTAAREAAKLLKGRQ